MGKSQVLQRNASIVLGMHTNTLEIELSMIDFKFPLVPTTLDNLGVANSSRDGLSVLKLSRKQLVNDEYFFKD